ncbi:sec-independent protein translocase protein TatA [Persephonella hydrogeniphila]|uniref:Sec-independent protein translocase protein TatA n=1 Tax=Persephonella hydrogeniphila TaxID=198703 RepID=A0A285NMW7_9AQUI|nr:twin-arginine translocase TatA/TatE family subunit [Persephonella hydrogeniphila]SNZ10850.1 sec-independent protein translocase protein TatA [Persephonella hydrogeniphila]
MIGGIGIPELLLIFGILLLLFGARKLPEIGRGLGEGIRSFKSSLSGEENKEEEKVVKAKELEPEIKEEKKVETTEKEKTQA